MKGPPNRGSFLFASYLWIEERELEAGGRARRSHPFDGCIYGAPVVVSGCQAGDNADSRGRVHLVNRRTSPLATSTSEIAVQSLDGEVSNAIVLPSGDHASPYVQQEK